MKKFILALSALLATTVLSAAPSYANEGITLWKEYPVKYYPKKAKVIRMKNFSTVEACHDAMMREINSKQNFENNILFFCL